MTELKTFKDLAFEPIEELKGSKQAIMNFENRYGVSVLFGKHFYSNGIDTYEVGVLHNGHLTYNTDITDDVISNVSEGEVSDIMRKVQEL